MIHAASKTLPQSARALGYAGVLPFVALTLLHFFGNAELEQSSLRGFLAYGAIILSFLGGIRWGVATRFDRLQSSALLISILPSLWAFACLLWPDPVLGAWGLLLGFAVMGLADWLSPAPGSASWMIVLRTRLSVAVVACHVIFLGSLLGAS